MIKYSVKTGLIKGARAGAIATGAINAVQGEMPVTQEKVIEMVVEFLVVTAVEFIRNWFKSKKVIGVKSK